MPFLLHLKYPFFCLDFREVFLNFHLHVVICACACSVTRLRQLKKIMKLMKYMYNKEHSKTIR